MSTLRPSHLARLSRLRPERKCAVLERAAIKHEACPGMTWDEADDAAWAEEAYPQRELPGVTS